MDETRARTVAATRALLASGGPAAVTMRAVAERVGVTATALYRHFPDKETLLGEVLLEDARVVARYLFPALEAPDAEARLASTAEGYLRFAEAESTLYAALMAAEAGTGGPNSLSRQREALHRFLRDRVREVLRADAPGEAVEELTRLLLATLHGAATLPPEARPRLETALRAIRLLGRDRIAAPSLQLT
jgi:AcrR family transcriptional regulator